MRAKDRLIAQLEADLAAARDRVAVLEGREWHRYEVGDRPIVAMPAPGPDPDDGYEWLSDATGLVRERVRRAEAVPGE